MTFRLFISSVLTLLALTACGNGGDTVIDRLKRPLYTDSDNLNSHRSFILDSGRSAVFVWDGSSNQTFNTGRTPHPKGFIGIPIGTQSFLSKKDVIYRGFAVTPTGSAMAVAYSYGFSDRVSQLRVVPLVPFPVDPSAARIFVLPPDVIGPFVTPEGRFLIVEPLSADLARWRTFPEPVSSLSGPNVRTMTWNEAGSLVYAADGVNESLHVFTWPDFQPVTTVTVDGFPIDLDVHPETGGLAVITSDELIKYAAPPSMPVVEHTSLPDVPHSVLYSRKHGGEILAVLNQNTTVSFFQDETLCGVDVQSPGFTAQNLVFIDNDEFSDAELQTVGAAVCASRIPDQLWQIIFEGLVSSGKTEVFAANAVTGVSWQARDVQVGDPIIVGGFASEVTAINETLLYFAPVTGSLGIGTSVTYQSLAGNGWAVHGARSGYIGRFQSGEVFDDLLRLEISVGDRKPTRGDLFTFESRANVTPIRLGGVPSSISEDPFGRFLVPVPDNGYVRAIDVQRDETEWGIQTLYTIP